MSDTTIARIDARRVWDSRGRPTVEAGVTLAGGAVGRAIAPAGASRGAHEAVDLRDGGAAFGGFGVAGALANVAGPIAEAVVGLDAADQAAVDAAILALDPSPTKARLGGNATVAVSMAVLHAAAAAGGMPLWRHLAGEDEPLLPLPQIQIFGGGAHAGRRLDVQDFMVIPIAAENFDAATAMAAEIYRAAGALMAEHGTLRGVADEGGFWPEFATCADAIETLIRAIERAGYEPLAEAAIALDIAAGELLHDGRYRLDGRELDAEAMVATIEDWVGRYPIVSIEDPVAPGDMAAMRALTESIGERVQIVGDDFLVTNAGRIAEAAAAGACNAALIKPNQAGTVTEAHAALKAARTAGWGAIVSARSGESEDVTIVHLAVGWAAGQLKVGSFARSERMAKWNEAIRIEQALGADARFAGGAPLPGSRLG